jgi:hypothetical protein
MGIGQKASPDWGRIIRAQFGFGLGIVILPNLNYTIIPEIIEGITMFLAENFGVIFYN